MKHRDVLIKNFEDNLLVIATDNSAGIGYELADVVRADPQIVGRLTARVALMEACSVGASPIALSCTMGFSLNNSSAHSLLKGIKQELLSFGIDEECLTGSSESNYPIAVTSVGVTVAGIVKKTKLKLNQIIEGDNVFVLGEPLVGSEVLEHLNELPSATTLRKLQSINPIHEVIPCGSKGIYGEIEKLSDLSSWSMELSITDEKYLKKSAGPATCLLIIGDITEGDLKILFQHKIKQIGVIRSHHEKNI